jgi:hypothetical protein
MLAKIDDLKREELPPLPAYDIRENCAIACAEAGSQIVLRKAHKRFSEYAYDHRKFPDDSDDGILCESNGAEFRENGRGIRAKKLYNKNVIGYLVASSFSIDRKHVSLTRCALYGGNGFHVRRDNFMEKLPLFAAATFPYDKKWFTIDVYSLTYDGEGHYLKDEEFLKKCLIYTALTLKNKCRSLLGSDGRFYRNELCVNENTATEEVLKNFHFSTAEENLLTLWHTVLSAAQQKEEYTTILRDFPDATLGPWQISQEINVRIPSGRMRNGKEEMIPKYAELNTAIKTLSHKVDFYYASEIIRDLFSYELVK